MTNSLFFSNARITSSRFTKNILLAVKNKAHVYYYINVCAYIAFVVVSMYNIFYLKHYVAGTNNTEG